MMRLEKLLTKPYTLQHIPYIHRTEYMIHHPSNTILHYTYFLHHTYTMPYISITQNIHQIHIMSHKYH
ncbi:hypothetical protein EON63_14615 [archaeon]|nr:MAG: hypothetical protein EON63_14615 [archaeon]